MTQKLLMSVIAAVMTFSVQATKIQILHTNDIHSQLDHTDHLEEQGGYARLKTLIDSEKNKAQRDGIFNLTMDAGDFLEGNIYYLADKGRKVFELHDMMGFDVVTIGNHDYLMGTDDLDAILGDVKPSFAFLGANLFTADRFQNIHEQLRPYTEFEYDGVKIGVLGLTTNDILYKWRINEGGINNEYDTCKQYAKELRERGNHVIIALTHMGLSKDKKLAEKCPEVDVIVGGHSHHTLEEVLYVENKLDKRVPIVQTGFHGRFLGRLNLNYDNITGEVTVDKYKLLPVIADEDPEILAKIEETNEDLYAEYGEKWLDEVVGRSELDSPLEGGNKDIWGHFINDSMREQTGSDFSIHVEPMSGLNYPTHASITRRDLYNGNPRTFEFDKKFGYNVYTARIHGGLVKTLFRIVMKAGLPLYVSGITFDIKKFTEKGYVITNLRFKGEKINPFKTYSVSLNEGIVRGGYSISKLVKLILKDGANSGVSMWEAMENKLSRIKLLDETYLDDYGRKGNIDHVDRGYIPGIRLE
ncbi:bifunctional UDP-sugar hydrolase/5'-nucleotidase [Halobacteriovorax sp. JY17]|uniref:bifunctional metallophosphatase/5'-nucleotidase n=1 Tax=Halobacteriovorax sp. JY17 TaxID=2014617 RepID=UPI000C556799|nr:bifunctional UDP-sugar hydrolase/5'-nucleotidase [Halobacteriovorax sp. JY17]PIK14650.1 MAG: hypothetical protein CES88_09940 [Halobacteriovorax sp. JY17]